MHKFFSFKGVVRSNDPIVAGDGECMELLNLRPCNGSFKPVPEHERLAMLKGRYSAVHWHGMTGYYVGITDDGTRTLHFYDKDWNVYNDDDGNVFEFKELNGVTAVELLGNVICCMTDSGIKYLLFCDGFYRYLGECPELPDFEVVIENKLHVLTTEVEFSNSSSSADFESSWRYNKKGYIDECIHYLNNDGFYIDRALFRFALRLYDGSYIYCSHVICVSDEKQIDYVGRDAYNFNTSKTGSGDTSTYKVKVKGFKPEFTFTTNMPRQWKDLVMGIDLFTTGSIMGHKVETLLARLRDNSTGVRVNKSFEGYELKGIEELRDDILSASLFYKVAEFDADGRCIHSVKDVSMNELRLQQGLDMSSISSSYSSFIVESSLVLNNRLHIASLRERLFAGFEASMLKGFYGTEKRIEGIAIETSIRGTEGVMKVVKNYGTPYIGYHDGLFHLPPLLMYPDSRAFEMKVYVILDTELFVKSFKLTPHRHYNYAQYLNVGNRSLAVRVESHFVSGFVVASVADEDVLRLFSYKLGRYEVVYSAADNCWKYNGRKFPPSEFSNLRVFAIPRDVIDGDKIVFVIEDGEGDTVFVDIKEIPIDSGWSVIGGSIPEDKRVDEERCNVLKVSAVDNPFVFPAECTYSPSQSRVTAMASNAMELSQGKFGEHPLFLFCEDGIWAMSIDSSGRVAYSGCYPFSREVCMNGESVCSIGSGVVFVAEQGMMLISGNRIKNLSFSLVPGNNLTAFHQENDFLVKVASLVGLESKLGYDDFNEYLRSCRVGYDACHRELLVSNATSDGYYVYSLDDGMWSRVSVGVSGFVASSTSLMMLSGSDDRTEVLVLGNELSGSNRVFLVTRPQPFGTRLYKRIAQLVIHACVSLPNVLKPGVPVVACYLMGSNDGLHFRILAGREYNKDVQDVRFHYFPTQAYRYYIFAIAGDMGVSTLLTGIETHVQTAWDSRLR